jgi:hypothetical protein
MIFDVKYDLKYKARIVAGGNWTVNDKGYLFRSCEYKEKTARQIHNTSQLPNRAKKDKVKKVLALINQIQIQDACSSDEESSAVPPTKPAMVCKLAQISPEIWMTLPLEAKKLLLNER